ncbi:hypothetical protein ACFWY5_36740 [Nonomuraea sp. NPDC059007]|uniref:hypothetical protein n=1 Tax=Nonomuraea sp. NPDC059007 TaxID=3346692 RepID=UPI003684C65E
MDVESLLGEAYGMPYGEARTVVTERALRAAEAARDPGLVVLTRFELTAAYQLGGEPAKSFAVFSRNLADYDRDPSLFGERRLWRLLWQYKWIVGSLRRFPEIPLRRALDGLDDMERRYREAGEGLQAVYARRCHVAQHLGDRAAAEEWFHRWRTAPRDELSDCAACDVRGVIAYLAWTGRDEEAIVAAAPVLSGAMTCSSQPQGILEALLLPYVRTGRLEEAASAHRRAYRIVQGRLSDLDDMGTHLRFLALTGNESRGLEILQRELHLLERPPSPSAARAFMTGAAVLLRRLEELGHGDTPVRRGGADIPAAGLRAEMEAGARGVAAAFDARNGTGEHLRDLEEVLAAAPYLTRLVLTPAAGESDPARLLARAGKLRGDGEDAEAAALFERAAGLYRRAGDRAGEARAMLGYAKSVYYAADEGEEIRAAYARARPVVEAAREESPQDLAELAYDEAVALDWLELHDDALRACREAVARYTALGITHDGAISLLEELEHD